MSSEKPPPPLPKSFPPDFTGWWRGWWWEKGKPIYGKTHAGI